MYQLHNKYIDKASSVAEAKDIKKWNMVHQ